MSNPPAIRRAAPEDVQLIAPLFDAYRVFYGRASDPADAEAFIAERLARSESVIFLAHAAPDGPPIGFTQLYPAFSSVSMRRSWILNDLYVDPAHRRSGAARALMERAADHARETGAIRLTLATAIDNTPAQSLYESLGWRRNTRFYEYSLTLE